VLTRPELLARFDAQMRIDPPGEPGITYDRRAGIVRARGAQNWIVWWTIDPSQTASVVEREARAFRAEQLALEWKVYGHDEPANLGAALSDAGFAADERETLMVLDLGAVSRTAPIELPDGITVRRVADAEGLRDFVALSSANFEYDASGLLTDLPPRLFGDAPSGVAYVAYAGTQPVAAGRLECPVGRAFASIWGGSTVPAFRGRGIFRALVAIRAEHARRANYPFLTVDARDTSRPILERLGFTMLTTVTGWNLQL
jgi:GNAT superfamily N-acetyltransferase